MRMIDADALIKSIKSHTVEDNGLTNDYKAGLTDSIRTAVALAENASTIEAVVRCGECANAKRIDKNESVYTCTHPQWTRRPHKDTFEESQLFHGLDGNDFCSYGEGVEDKP